MSRKKIRSKRKFVATGITTAMVASVAAPVLVPAVQAAGNFSDVNSDAFYSKAVNELASKGIIGGYSDGTFQPNKQVTRAEAAKILAYDLGLTSKQAISNFTDVNERDWFFQPVTALAASRGIGGYEDDTFKPNKTITRAEMASLLVKAYGLEENSTTAIPFTDVPVDSWYRGAVEVLYANNVTSGKGAVNRFAPNDPVTRGEIAVFIQRASQVKAGESPQEQVSTGTAVEEVTVDGIVIGGTTYSLADNVKGILGEHNEAVLKGAVIDFEDLNGVITKIDSIKLNATGKSGATEFSNNLVLDGKGNTVGAIVVNANYITVKNVTIEHDLTITEALANDFYAEKVTVKGNTIVEGGDDNTVAFNDSQLNNVDLNKSGLHFLAKGSTTLGILNVLKSAKLTSSKAIPKVNVKGGAQLNLGKDTKIDDLKLPDGVSLKDVVNSSEARKNIKNINSKSNSEYQSTTSGGGNSSSSSDCDSDSDDGKDPQLVQTHAPLAANISVVNAIGENDTITVKALDAKATVRVYTSATDNKVIKSAIADNATVSLSGINLGANAGSVWITVQKPGELESARTKVDFVAELAGASGLALNKAALALTPTQSETLTATINVVGVNQADAVFSWESLDQDVATVDNNGTVTAKAAGKVLVRVTATLPDASKINSTCEVTVYEERVLDLTAGKEVSLGTVKAAPVKVESTVKLDDSPDAKAVNVAIGLPEVPAAATLTVSPLPADVPAPPKDAPFIALDIAISGYSKGEQFRVELDIPEGLNEENPGAYHYNSVTGIWEYREGTIESGKFVFTTNFSPVSIGKRVPVPKALTVTPQTTADSISYVLQWKGAEDVTYYKVFNGETVVEPRVEGNTVTLTDLADGMYHFYIRAYREESGATEGTKATFESAISNVVPIKIGGAVGDDTKYISDFFVDRRNLVLDEGDTTKINVITEPVDATEPLSWGSTNPFVASVDQKGNVKAIAPGTTTIYVHPLNNPSARKEILVIVQGEEKFAVTPTEVELVSAPGELSNAINLEAIFKPDAKVDMLDVVFAFDTTGSMSGAIDAAKENAIDIMNLIRSKVSDAQFGVVSFEDYSGYTSENGYWGTYGGPDDDPYMLDQAVTDNPTLVQQAIDKLFADDGYDGPESYTRALYELSDQTPRVDSVRWRTGAKKLIVLFGDAPTHDLTFAGENTGEDPGRDGIGNTEDDLRFVDVVNSLRSQGIIVLAVDSYDGYNSTLKGMSIGYLPSEADTWEGTEGTNGKYVYLYNSSLPIIVDDFVKEQVKVIHSIKVVAPEGYENWITTDPNELRNIPLPEGSSSEDIVNKLDLYIQPPADTPAGEYEFKLAVYADGVELGTVLARVTVDEARVTKPIPSVLATKVPNGAEITLSTNSSDAIIHYTVDGSEPTTSSPIFTTGDTITITGDTVVKAIAVRGEGDSAKISDVMVKNYSVLKLEKPLASRPSGEVRSGSTVELKTNDSGAEIFYTMDGTEPSEESIKYKNPIEIANDTTIKAISVVKSTLNDKEYVTKSDVNTFTYTVSTKSSYDHLDNFVVGGINLSTYFYGLSELEVDDPDSEDIAEVEVEDFTGFAGIDVSSFATVGSITVTVNGTVIPEESLASQAIQPGDTILVTVASEDGYSNRYYKVKFVQEVNLDSISLVDEGTEGVLTTGDSIQFKFTTAIPEDWEDQMPPGNIYVNLHANTDETIPDYIRIFSVDGEEEYTIEVLAVSGADLITNGDVIFSSTVRVVDDKVLFSLDELVDGDAGNLNIVPVDQPILDKLEFE
ncbi:S-layer homology domain-containing protein [Schinkia sp. CFF1]